MLCSPWGILDEPILIYVSVLIVKLNGGRAVTGILRGFDPYMNIVLDDAVEERSSKEKFKIGMVVSCNYSPVDQGN